MITVMIAVNDNCYNRSTRLFALLFCQVYSGDTILIIAVYGSDNSSIRSGFSEKQGCFYKMSICYF